MINYNKGNEIKIYEDFKDCEKIYVIKYDDFDEELTCLLIDGELLTEEGFNNFLKDLKNQNKKIFKAIPIESYAFSKNIDKEIIELASQYFDIDDEYVLNRFIFKIKDIIKENK